MSFQITAKEKDKFVEQARDKLEEASNLLALFKESPWESGHLSALSRICHRLAGGAGFFDMLEFANLASESEGAALVLLKKNASLHKGDGTHPLAAEIAGLQKFLSRLSELLSKENNAATKEPEPENHVQDRRVLLVCSEPRQAIALSDFLRKQQLTVESFRTCAMAREQLLSQSVKALLIVSSVADNQAQSLTQEFRRLYAEAPLFLLSGQPEFRDKVMAVKLGIDKIFEAPFDFEKIAQYLNEQLCKEGFQGYRILSVEDDPVQSEIISSTLQSAGYAVMSICDPSQFEEALVSFLPDLLLLDVDLGGEITGLDLSRYLRKTERFATIPIVFLTTRNQLCSFLEGTAAGGDDYLVKPVSTQYLIANLSSRIERHRLLQSMMEKDATSSVYRYSHFFLRCQNHLDRYKTNDNTALLVFNLDKLSSINRSLGLAAGDRAIGALGKILRMTFRQTDLIGRTAGDEITLLCDYLGARELAEICMYTAAELSCVEGYSPPLKVSVGIVGLADSSKLEESFQKAREAVKTAKQNGGGTIFRI